MVHLMRRVASLCAFLSLISLPIAAEVGLDRAAYEASAASRYSSTGVSVPAEGAELKVDVAQLRLASGHVHAQQPLADGAVTSLWFEGRGTMEMEIPDRIEREHYRRSSGEATAEGVRVDFTRLLLISSDSSLLAPLLSDGAGAAPHEVHKGALGRRDQAATHEGLDLDARLIAARRGAGPGYFFATLETEQHGWLSFELDPLRREEIHLSRYDGGSLFTEIWVALDQEGERLKDGRPGSRPPRSFDLETVTIRADLTAPNRRSGRVGFGRLQPRRGVFDVELEFRPKASGAQALALKLSPWAEVEAVESADGQALEFLRDHWGKRSSSLDKDLWDEDLVVLLENPLVAGEERRLRVRYSMDVVNYAPGRSWYPGEQDGFNDLHTGRLELTVLGKHDVRAMGQLVSAEDRGKNKVSIWEIERPARMLTFSFSERFKEQTVSQEGAPEVIAFSTSGGGSMKNKTYNVAADVSNSLRFLQRTFASELPSPKLYATSIIAGHGQSFDGFLHLAESTFEYTSGGATELFRAHEVAHQWWGHLVSWDSYRDQWLSESFAEFSAMLFVEAALEDGRKTYDQIVDSYIGMVLGKVDKVNKYSRFPFESNPTLRARLGPIGLGYRASTADTPQGYFQQAYVKGPVVLHMLRAILRNATKSDELFFDVIREFIRRHEGGAASTDDFIAVLESKARGDWDWFFDQWIHGTELPAYEWSWGVAGQGEGGKVRIALRVTQKGVSPGFRMPVPVELDFGQGRKGQIVVLVDEPDKEITLDLPAKPKKVTFNAGSAVLASVKKVKHPG